MTKRLGLTQTQANEITFYKATGCDDCLNMGYKGRLAIFEIMEITDKISRLIVQRTDASVIKKQAIKDGMTTLAQDGIRCIKNGHTTIEEVLSVAFAEEVLE